MRAQSTWRLERKKIVNNGVVSRYPSRSVEYNAVGSGPSAAECTLWKWVWLAKNCARVKCRLRVTDTFRLDICIGLTKSLHIRFVKPCTCQDRLNVLKNLRPQRKAICMFILAYFSLQYFVKVMASITRGIYCFGFERFCKTFSG